MLKSRGFRKPTLERVRSPLIPNRGRSGVIAQVGDVVVATPKRRQVRNKALREAYRKLPCQWPTSGEPGICGAEDGTVCCAHSNWGEHGKGGAQKADDNHGASLCHRHHAALDQGSALSAESKRAGWEAAHKSSVGLLLFEGLWPDSVPFPAGVFG